jgi:hypothetical protein
MGEWVADIVQLPKRSLSNLGVAASPRKWGALGLRLRLVAQTLLVPVFLHPLPAFVFGYFGFSSFFQRTHNNLLNLRGMIFILDPQPGAKLHFLIDDLVERVLDDPFRPKSLQFRQNLADNLFVDNRLNGNPTFLRERRDGRISQ